MKILKSMSVFFSQQPAGRFTPRPPITHRASGTPCLPLLCVLTVLNAPAAFADLSTFAWNSGFTNGGVVPDGNTTGWSDTRALSGIAENFISDVNVTLTLTGGWNGDLYGYLTHSSGFSVLLNRAGRTSANAFGYADPGLNISLDDAAANDDIHLYQSVAGYATTIADGSAWAPDGREVNPLGVLDTDARTAWLSSFNGLDPNGTWTLFLADVSNGEVSTVAGWGLEITTVPEPTTGVLVLLGCLVAAASRRFRARG